ncbi:MAG: hypothetical protein NC218_09695 [Acetobacter sp.]|nr:hypothetical protein [Acetobacter sp.]
MIAALVNSFSIREALFSLGLSDAGANYVRARKLMNDNNVSLLKKKEKQKENFCVDCGKPICPESERCPSCANKNRSTLSITREELKSLIRTTPFTKIGEQFNVTDNAVRKWCDKYGLPRRVKDIKSFSDDDWVKI